MRGCHFLVKLFIIGGYSRVYKKALTKYVSTAEIRILNGNTFFYSFVLIFQVKMRTLRIGIVNVFCSVGVPIGTALSGVLFRELGFYGVYIIATVLYIFAFVYGMVFIKETKSEINIESKESPRDTSCVDFLKDFFSLSHIKEAVRVTFKEGQYNRRLRIIALMVVVIVVMGPLHG